jgi:hypothetical protein
MSCSIPLGPNKALGIMKTGTSQLISAACAILGAILLCFASVGAYAIYLNGWGWMLGISTVSMFIFAADLLYASAKAEAPMCAWPFIPPPT